MSHSTWSAVPGKIQTRWAKDVKPDCPLPDYPRPQLTRKDWVNLNGLWDYAILPLDEDMPNQYQGQILVPFPVESSLSGVCKPLQPNEHHWYRSVFKIPTVWKPQ